MKFTEIVTGTGRWISRFAFHSPLLNSCSGARMLLNVLKDVEGVTGVGSHS